MKVLLINGSPRQSGNTALALNEVAQQLATEGIDTEILWIGNKPIRGCIACNQCATKSLVVVSSTTTSATAYPKNSPTPTPSSSAHGQPNGALLSIIQRAFYSNGANIAGKPAASIALCRRGGATAAFESLNMPFQMMNMPIVTSQYWNIVYGRTEGEAALDTEGLQTMRTLARNMAWLLKTTNGTPAPGRPSNEPWDAMHFIR